MNRKQKYHQGYLDAAPFGIDARYSWNFKGGRGEGKVRFIDIQQGWILNHANFSVNSLTSTGINCSHSTEHGAAVLGVILMNGENYGIVGIAPKVESYVISTWRPDGKLNIADAISSAVKQLSFGDVLLLTIERQQSKELVKGLPIEIHEGVFDAINQATNAGIIIVESAGNGDFNLKSGIDLDEFIWNGRKVFNRSQPGFVDSGAIIVGGATDTVPHKKTGTSNYGSRVDCYAWGENVVTAGNYPKSSGTSLSEITDEFCGTSSAASIIAGAVISLQSICEANYGYRLSPNQMREILSGETFGTPSINGRAIDKIGVMPDLKKIIDEKLKMSKKEN